jgi:hypothetical protein
MKDLCMSERSGCGAFQTLFCGLNSVSRGTGGNLKIGIRDDVDRLHARLFLYWKITANGVGP